MGGLFSLDSPLCRTLTKIADIWILNFIFVITSLPVVTLGASITALNHMSMKMARGKEGYIIRGYLKSFKQNFKQSTILFLIVLLAGVVLVADMYFWMGLGSTAGYIMAAFSTAIFLVYFMELIYVFAVQATFENPIKRTLKNALLMALQRLPMTILLGVFVGIVIYFNINFFAVNIFMVLYGFGLSAMGTAVLYNWAFQKYIKEEGKNECGEQGCDEQEGDGQECNNE